MSVSFWKKNNRWYKIEIDFDLFGDLILKRAWGSINSPGRGRVVSKVMNVKSIEKLEAKTKRRCIKLGYELVQGG